MRACLAMSACSLGDHEGGYTTIAFGDCFAAHSISHSFEECNGTFVALSGGEAEPFVSFNSRFDRFRFGTGHAGALTSIAKVELGAGVTAFCRAPKPRESGRIV